MKNNKKGFAVSGILYPLLILTLFLVVQMLFMLQTRKNVLDKSRSELADSVNASNKVYNNEELTILLEQYKADYETKIAELDKKNHVSTKRSFSVKKRISSANYNPTKIIISNFTGPVALDMKIYGNYQGVNYGGYVEYKMGAAVGTSSLYGLGTSYNEYGNLANIIASITPTYSEPTLTLTINFSNIVDSTGSDIFFNIDLYRGLGIEDNTTVTIQ